MILGKHVLKICSKFIGEHPCQSAVSIKLPNNFIEITLRHGRRPVNLLHIFRTPFSRNTSGVLLMSVGAKEVNTIKSNPEKNQKGVSFSHIADWMSATSPKQTVLQLLTGNFPKTSFRYYRTCSNTRYWWQHSDTTCEKI